MKPTVVAFLALLLLLSGCSALRKTGAAVALPFTGIGESVLLPFQGLGAASEGLRIAGRRHCAEVRAEYAGYETIEDYEFDQLSMTEMAELTSLVYYIPGWALYPFDALTPDTPFYCSRHLIAELEETHPFTEKSRYRVIPAP